MSPPTPRRLPGQLTRDAHGRLLYTDEQGLTHVGVLPVRAFPIEAPLDGLSLVGPDGHELCWVDQLSRLDADQRQVLEEELALREFMPTILRLVSVSTFATPSTWTVDTDRGRTPFILKGEEDIRRLRDGGLLISDSHGLVFRIPDIRSLDRHSRKLLDRFL